MANVTLLCMVCILYIPCYP